MAVTSMPLSRKARMTGFTSSAVIEVASDRRLAASGRLKVNHGAGSHGGWNWRAALGDRVLPWNRELVDAAIDLSLHTDGLVQGQRVEVDLCRLSRRRRRRTKWRLALAERGANGCRYGDGIAMPMNVHVVGGRVGAQQVIVKSRRCRSQAALSSPARSRSLSTRGRP